MESLQGFRIVHAIAQLRFGAGRYVVDVAIAQHRREPGRVAVVIAQDTEPPWVSSPSLVSELRAAGVPVFVAGHLAARQAPMLQAAATTIGTQLLRGAEWPADAVVHAHTPMAAVAARWAGAPRVVLTDHGADHADGGDVAIEEALACSLCDAVVSPSEARSARLRDQTALASIPVIPYACNVDRFPPAKDGFGSGPARVVSVGELALHAGADVLLESMPLVWQRFPTAELHFIGDGPLAGALRERAQMLDPDGVRVRFHGLVDEASALLADFDIFALPSRVDYQPMDLIEAMAAGLPIVATRRRGIAELVEAARCGFVLPPGDPEELATALRVLLEAGGIVRTTLGRFAAGYIRASHNLASHITRLETLYRPGSARARTPIVTLPPGHPVRLHIGSNTERREGWVNVDVRPEAEPDIVARAHELPMFTDGTVDTVEACHLLEHLPLHEARLALREWARVLRAGGELLLELPDFDACVGLIRNGGDPDSQEMAMMGVFGWSLGVERHGDAFAHHWGWSPQSLAAELAASGFEHIEQLPLTQTYRPSAQAHADFRLRAVRAQRAVAAA
jgi:glycosyltransferase involved in cell wall biosynthesis